VGHENLRDPLIIAQHWHLAFNAMLREYRPRPSEFVLQKSVFRLSLESLPFEL
jgi:hypothetical protein